MEHGKLVSTCTISLKLNQASAGNSNNTRRPKTRICRRVKKLVFCGLIQQKITSPSIESTPSTKSNIDQVTKMAENNPNKIQWHTLQSRSYEFHVPNRYQNATIIGQGNFGVVIRVTDTVLEKSVVIKKMLHPFDDHLYSQRTYRELKLLMHLNHPDAGIVRLYNAFTPDQNLNEFQMPYFVFNDAGKDIDTLIRQGTPFNEQLIRLVIYSILRGLKYLHSASVIHRDLKPQNIGIDKKSNVTILDFGLARVASNGVQTGYVSTRWWRAPEIYISWERYDEKVDIWSVGCIMAELILRRPVFPGTDHLSQLNVIFDLLGTPNLDELREICSEEIINYLRTLPPRPKQDYNAIFGYKYGEDPNTAVSGLSPEGIDLLDRLLTFNYRRRPTAVEALAHPFFRDLHDVNDEPTGERMVDEHADATYSVARWKSLIWQLLQDFTEPTWINDESDDENA